MRINRSRWVIAIGILAVAFGWPAVVRGENFSTVDEAVAHASAELAAESQNNRGAVVIYLDLDEDGDRSVKGILSYPGGKYYPCFTTTSVFARSFPAGKLEIQLRVAGHHEIHDEVWVDPGVILILDDLWPDPVMDRDGAEVLGIIKLENGEDPSGLCMNVGGVPAETDTHGRFRATGVGAGTASVYASYDGYTGLYKWIEVERGERRFVAMEGWRKRYALVQWAYQPDGTSSLHSGLESGTTILGQPSLYLVSFKNGFAQSMTDNDFQVHHVEDRLIMRRSLSGRNNKSAIIELPDIGFEEVRSAPKVVFPNREYELTEGAVYVFRCSDGEHYAKMQVLEIVDNDYDYARLVAEMARE